MEDFIEITLLAVLLVFVVKQRVAVPTKSSKSRSKVVLDTCALIDGRILPLNASGFLSDELIVPDFVVHELQMLADGSDSHKRERARFGLDVVKQLQDSPNTTVTIDRSITSKEPTDNKLVTLAKNLSAPLYTTDYNLNKVADIENVQVMNVNELAQNLRPIAIPGDRKNVKLLQKGSNPKQAVGYLEDGTMIVVDNAARSLGKLVEVEITRSHQTLAGKMLFANLIDGSQAVAESAEKQPQSDRRTRKPRVAQSRKNQY